MLTLPSIHLHIYALKDIIVQKTLPYQSCVQVVIFALLSQKYLFHALCHQHVQLLPYVLLDITAKLLVMLLYLVQLAVDVLSITLNHYHVKMGDIVQKEVSIV